MDDNFEKLKIQFQNIKKMGWIESKRKGTTGIGYTFEKLLNCEENNFSFPDYNGIEIKTKRYNSKGYVTLFNVVPDGDELFSLQKLYNDFGYPDKSFPQFNVLNISIFSNKPTYLGLSKIFRLVIDKKNFKIRIEAFDKFKNITNNSTSWSFKLLQETLERKINYLAFIKAHNKFFEDKEYFKYNEISLYKLKDFNTFISLIDSGIIRLTIKISIHKNEDKFGKMKCHGCGFDIHEDDIEKLFYKLY